MSLKQSDRELFGSISIDYLHLFIRKQKYMRNDKLGIYNQLKEIFSRHKGKVALFDEYLADWGGVAKVTADVVGKWEGFLYKSLKPNFYAHMFRIIRISPTKVDIYACTDGGNVLDKLCSSTDNNVYQAIKFYCEFWEYANSWCLRNDVVNPADLPVTQIKADFRNTLMANLIPSIEGIEVLSNTMDKYCLAYYNLDSGDLTAATPAWDNFLRQMVSDECRHAYRAWIYSLFKGDNYGRQILWLHGVGESGKSVTSNVIYAYVKSLNSQIVTTLESVINMDKFSLSSYTNKRLIMAADTTDRALVRNNLVKNLTGRDVASIRDMGKGKKESMVYGKVLITSNKTPFVNTESPEEVSRMLLISLVAEKCVEAKNWWYNNNFGDWANCLKNELPDFIRQCKASYDAFLMPNGHDLKHYDKHLETLELSRSYLRRDLPVWWECCIEETGNNEDTIKLSELSRDYERFLRGEMWVDQNTRFFIKSYTTTYLREIKIHLVELPNFNTVIVVGYKFREPEPKNRVTAKEVVAEQIRKYSHETKHES